MHGLNPRQVEFARHFAEHYCGATAFRAAYNKPEASSRVASERGRVLLKSYGVRRLVAELRGEPLPPLPTRELPERERQLSERREIAAFAFSSHLPARLRLDALLMLRAAVSVEIEQTERECGGECVHLQVVRSGEHGEGDADDGGEG